MKRVFAFLWVVLLLCGCRQNSDPIEIAVNLRESVLTADSITFQSIITADYGDVIYTFSLDCTDNKSEKLTFTVIEPESIAGITGIITNQQNALTFDDKILAFPSLIDGQLSPVMAPYIFIKALHSGYISACGKAGEGYCIYIDDTFQDNPLKLQVFTDADMVPVHADMIYRDLRILSVDIDNFTVL